MYTKGPPVVRTNTVPDGLLHADNLSPLSVWLHRVAIRFRLSGDDTTNQRLVELHRQYDDRRL